jgi:hypothetical protein
LPIHFSGEIVFRTTNRGSSTVRQLPLGPDRLRHLICFHPAPQAIVSLAFQRNEDLALPRDLLSLLSDSMLWRREGNGLIAEDRALRPTHRQS